jgi:hypothetical protein
LRPKASSPVTDHTDHAGQPEPGRPKGTNMSDHIRSYFDTLALGSAFTPSEIQTELRYDAGELTSSTVHEIRQTARHAAVKIAELRADGYLKEARDVAREASAKVADLIPEEAILPAPEQDDPRALAAKIRRR